MSYTTSIAKEVIENYSGLSNGCQLALKVLEHRFGQCYDVDAGFEIVRY